MKAEKEVILGEWEADKEKKSFVETTDYGYWYLINSNNHPHFELLPHAMAVEASQQLS